MSEARIKASMKYNANNTKRLNISLNIKTDADIIEYLDQVDNKQGLIKELIREHIKTVQ